MRHVAENEFPTKVLAYEPKLVKQAGIETVAPPLTCPANYESSQRHNDESLSNDQS